MLDKSVDVWYDNEDPVGLSEGDYVLRIRHRTGHQSEGSAREAVHALRGGYRKAVHLPHFGYLSKQNHCDSFINYITAFTAFLSRTRKRQSDLTFNPTFHNYFEVFRT